MLPLLPLLPLLPPLSGCELTEVTVPAGEARLIVQAVYSLGAPYQFVVVEESRTGASPAPEADADTIPFEGPQLGVAGALVTLGYRAGSACGSVVDTLPPAENAPGLYFQTTQRLCPVGPGDLVMLRVATADGRVVTGTTTLPGAGRAFAAAGRDTVTSFSVPLLLNRDRDTLRLGLDAVTGRAMQVEARRQGVEDELVFYLVLDTSRVAVPGDLVNPFEGDDGEPIFGDGEVHLLAVAVVDSNYYDFVRSRSDPFTGRGFINRLEGGIGVFGSVETHRFQLNVVSDSTDPR